MDTQLLVVGAGPYGLSTAALALEHDIDTVVLGRPMDFWKTNMPAGMFLRSGLDWHLDAAGIHTLAAYLEERAIAAGDVDPIPIGVFLDYAEWFRKAKRIKVREELTVDLDKRDGRFTATLENGEQIVTDAVVCAPGIRHYTTVPDWASDVPPGRAAHTCDLVRFDEMAGQRILIVGGRQSAYEWAALVREHGAARIDIVHRHDVPRFEQVSWRFVDEHVQRTLSVPGYWRNLARSQQEEITQRFWEVGRGGSSRVVGSAFDAMKAIGSVGWAAENGRLIRRRSNQHRPPPRSAAIRASELELRRRARAADGVGARVLAQPRQKSAEGNHPTVLGGRGA